MARKEENERLDDLRERLYARNVPAAESERRPLKATTADSPPAYVPPAAEPIEDEDEPFMTRIQNSGLRTKALAGAVIFFVCALLLSSAFLFFGQHTISSENIAIDVDAPFAIGGGEELTLRIAIMNRNSVAVESATLIVEYPPGTQEADGTGKELFRERIPLETIAPGEVRNVPLRSVLFGEENETRSIGVSVEYRVQGSNATFFTEADPVEIKISSSPVVLSLETLREVSSGQEMELTFAIASNAQEPIANVLVETSYPQGFDFSNADPKPVRGQNVWSIESLEPESEHTITVRGVMTGNQAEERTFSARVGVPSEGDRFALASIFTSIEETVELTDPFAALDVAINGSREGVVSLAADDTASVSITFENTLSETVRDAAITVRLTGSGRPGTVDVSGGFYNSSAGTITWDAGGVSGLRELLPGEDETVRFSIRDVNAAQTPQVAFDISVAGRRVSEDRVQQNLTSVASRTIRFETVTSISGYGLYSIGPFSNAGPMPPRAEQVTQYTVMLSAENGANELADAVVTASLPQYVLWNNSVSAGDAVSYNSGTREVSWNIGSLGAHATADAAFQVSILPSTSQVNTVPTLVGEQRLRATDRFTGTVIRGTSPAITTRLSQDPDQDAQDGRVQAP